jgi:uncharacterized protein
VKLVVDEPESDALAAHLAERGGPVLATSRIAVVEVTRAVSLANPSADARAVAERLVRSCVLVNVSDSILRRAAMLASMDVRSLDAIHLASAERTSPDELLVYDRRLAAAALAIGLTIAAPGAC